MAEKVVVDFGAGKPRAGGDWTLMLRCALCEAATGRASRIAFVNAYSEGRISVRDPKHGVAGQECIDFVSDGSEIRYFCRTCERRWGKRRYLFLDVSWVVDRVSEMDGSGQNTIEILVPVIRMNAVPKT